MALAAAGTMVLLLMYPLQAMDAVSASCRLFVQSVLPGLFPYMVLSQLLVSRLPYRAPLLLAMSVAWGGGSPTGARLTQLVPLNTLRAQRQLAVSCATMSPMFLLGTLGTWLGSPKAGWVLLLSVLTGGALTGCLAGRCTPEKPVLPIQNNAAHSLTFGEAVEQAARTMLLVCGTMAMLRVLAQPFFAYLPAVTLLEITAGAKEIAGLPLPLPLRTAFLAGATGFGGMAGIMQNRALYPQGLLSLPAQCLWQAVHGGISFLLALGLMTLT